MGQSPRSPSWPSLWPFVTLATCSQTETISKCIFLSRKGIFTWITLQGSEAVSRGIAPILGLNAKANSPWIRSLRTTPDCLPRTREKALAIQIPCNSPARWWRGVQWPWCWTWGSTQQEALLQDMMLESEKMRKNLCQNLPSTHSVHQSPPISKDGNHSESNLWSQWS